MEGPTPVSALIHAATMVTAGVYLIVRTHPIFEQAPRRRRTRPPMLGALTLVVAGLIALVQTDIKRVIAYSTMSQIGYMFVGAGIGAYANGDVPPDDARLLQGAALHGGRHRDPRARRRAGHPQDRRRSARSRRSRSSSSSSARSRSSASRRSPASSRRTRSSRPPSTRGWVGYVALRAGLVGTFLTGLYTFRLFFIVFRGEPTRVGARALPPPRQREGPLVDARAGRRARGALRDRRLDPVLAVLDAGRRLARAVAEPLVEPSGDAGAASRASSPSGSARRHGGRLARSTDRPARGAALASVREALEHKLCFDELYDAVFYRPAAALARALDRVVERPVIAGSLTALGFGAHGRDSAGYVAGADRLVRTYVLALAGALAIRSSSSSRCGDAVSWRRRR